MRFVQIGLVWAVLGAGQQVLVESAEEAAKDRARRPKRGKAGDGAEVALFSHQLPNISFRIISSIRTEQNRLFYWGTGRGTY